MHLAYIALGSNLDIPSRNIGRALRLMPKYQMQVIDLATPLENPAVGGPPNSPDFVNTVAKIETSLSPQEVLTALLDIEHQLGRTRRQKWEPRIIDLDLLLYDDQIIDTPDLKIPHPLMHQRRFVLQPLAQIAPDLVHPTLHKSVKQLLAELP